MTPLVQDHLERFVAELLGEAPRVTHRWAGIFGTTAVDLPLVGRYPGRPDVSVCCGYSGHGNVMGLMCCDLLAHAILVRLAPELELELFEPARLLAV